MMLQFKTIARHTLTEETFDDVLCAFRSSEIIFIHEAFDDDRIPEGTTIHLSSGDIVDVVDSFSDVLKKIVESEVESGF